MPANATLLGRDDVRLVYTSAVDGDFSPLTQSAIELESRRRRLVDRPWTQLAENHGISVVSVVEPGAGDGDEGDVMVTSAPGAVLGIWTGDCAPVCVVGERAVAAIHAGWRGLRDGVLEAAVEAIIGAGDRVRSAWVGPHIGPCCYEFGADDLKSMTQKFGHRAAASDQVGRPALDVDECIRAGLDRAVGRSVDVVSLRHCTGCHGDGYFSHRIRRDTRRQVMAVWIEGST